MVYRRARQFAHRIRHCSYDIIKCGWLLELKQAYILWPAQHTQPLVHHHRLPAKSPQWFTQLGGMSLCFLSSLDWEIFIVVVIKEMVGISHLHFNLDKHSVCDFNLQCTGYQYITSEECCIGKCVEICHHAL